MTQAMVPTKRQQELHEFMLGYQRSMGMPPTHRAIARHLGIKSTYAIACHLNLMLRKGMVIHHAGSARGWIAVEKTEAR